MDENNSTGRIKNCLSTVLGIENNEINEQTSPDNVDGWDSLKYMNLVIALEEEFGIQFTEEEIESMLNFKLIRLAVEEALNRT